MVDAMPDAIGALIAIFVWLKLVSGMSYSIDMDESRMTIGLDTGRMAEQVAELALASMRAGARVEYESVTYDPRAGALGVTGLVVDAGSGAARIERLDITGVSKDQPIDVRIAFQGLDAPASALELPPPAQIQFALLGIDRLQGDGAIDLAYVLETSSARIEGELEMTGVGRIGLEALFEGLRLDPKRDHEPAGALARLALAFENGGALEAIGPSFGIDPDDPSAGRELARALSEQLVAALSDGAAPLPAFEETGEAVESALSRFFEDGDSIAVTLTPEPPLDFAELERLEAMTASARDRARLLDRLGLALAAKPVSAAPVVTTLALPAGAPLAQRLAVAEALATGTGAPRDPDAALDILAPPAEAGDPHAAAAMAKILLERGRAEDLRPAYSLLLLGMAAGVDGAAASAAKLAASLPAGALLEAEAAARETYDVSVEAMEELRAAAANGDATAMRRLAIALDDGRLTLRDTPSAYRWALLGAAAGDAAASRLRDRIAGRFAHGAAQDRETWSAMLAEAAAEATALWMNGLAARVAAE